MPIPEGADRVSETWSNELDAQSNMLNGEKNT